MRFTIRHHYTGVTLICLSMLATNTSAQEFGTRGSADLRQVRPIQQTFKAFKAATETRLTISVAKNPNQPKNPRPSANGTISIEEWAGNKAKKVASVNTETTRFIGGIKPGVKVALPRHKRRWGNLDCPSQIPNCTITYAPQTPQDEKLEKPDDMNSVALEESTNFVSGNAMGLNETTTLDKVTGLALVKDEKLVDDKKTQPLSIRILFSQQSNTINPTVIENLSQLAQVLKTNSEIRLELAAYASGENAKRLSLSRALQVRKILLNEGINSNRLIIKTKGADDPKGPPDRVDVKELEML